MNEQRILRWGVLGTAGIAKNRTIPGMMLSAKSELYAIAGRNPAKLQAFADEFHPTVTYDNYQAVLDDPNVDVVYIPLPNNLHKEWVIKAAKAGKHILCEKPLAMNEEEVKEMFAAAKEAGVILEEAYAYRHAQLIHKVKELIDSGAIGRIRCLNSTHSTFDNNKSGIRYMKGKGGGAVYDVTCYNVSLASYLLGKDPISYSVSCGIDEETGVDTSNAILLSYGDGVSALLYAGLDAYPRGYFSVLGDTGRLDVDYKFNSRGVVKISVGTGAVPHSSEYVDEVRKEYTIWVDDNYNMEIDLFNDAVLNGTPLEIGEEESLRTARICDAIRKAGGLD